MQHKLKTAWNAIQRRLRLLAGTSLFFLVEETHEPQTLFDSGI